MKKKFLARLTTGLLLSVMVTGLLIFGMAGMASADPMNNYFPDPLEVVGPITGSTTYDFDFTGLYAPDEFSTGALFIKET
ncbi:MAG: hypothetical protein ABFR31_12915, partial [Thermodesulfobacteriota bacterium]